MTEKQLLGVDSAEEKAIEEMKGIFPKEIEGYNYGDLLYEIYKKETIEAQLVKFFDHLDAFGETLHEFFAGNNAMLVHAENEYGRIILPVDYYIQRFERAEKNYPLLASIFKKKTSEYTPFSCDTPRWDFENQYMQYIPHTTESLKKDTGYVFYEWWKNIILAASYEKGKRNLLNFSPKRYYL